MAQIIDLRIDYAGHVDQSQHVGFRCTHGENECIGNMYQLCATNLTSPSVNNYTWWDFFTCMDHDQSAVPGNAKPCAEKLNLDYAAIDTCANSELGKMLFAASIRRTDAAPMRAPCGRSQGAPARGLRKQSRGSSRGGIAAATSPSGWAAGMSFME